MADDATRATILGEIDTLTSEITVLNTAKEKLQENATKYYEVLNKLKTALASVEETAGGSQDTLLKENVKNAVSATITSVDSGKASVESAVSATIASIDTDITAKNDLITQKRNQLDS